MAEVPRVLPRSDAAAGAARGAGDMVDTMLTWHGDVARDGDGRGGLLGDGGRARGRPGGVEGSKRADAGGAAATSKVANHKARAEVAVA